MTIVARAAEILRTNWLVVAVTLVVVPAAAVAIADFGTDDYRCEATLEFTGRNTGSLEGDVLQARQAAETDGALALRALDVTKAGSLGAKELQDELELDQRPGRLALAITRESRPEVNSLCDEFAFQLARDQRATVISSDTGAKKVGPSLVETALLALGAAIPVAAGLAALVHALRRRRSPAA